MPERIRNGASAQPGVPGASKHESISWIIEIASQVVFSNTASVNYEVLVGRDAKSLELGAASIADLPAPGHLRDHKHNLKEQQKGKLVTVKGVYSESVKLRVEDTASLWTSPRFPSWNDRSALKNLEDEHAQSANLKPPEGAHSKPVEASKKAKKRKKVHFVVITHGLHSNLGADMLYLKESIDAAARQARVERKRAKEEQKNSPFSASASASRDENENDDDEEEVIVRGFPGNAGRTERGIQYLGKRLAKYILLMTYPDQPYIPVKSKPKISFSSTFGLQRDMEGPKIRASHSGSTIYRREPEHTDYAYQITSISFIGHSLGGLVQTYAIAYIQKHSPEFFDFIKPVNFVALASPFLGLSHENPMYVKFALDFGLVGRTGQDLGLSWSAPSKMRSGWEAMIGGLGTDANKSEGHPEPGAKPLLRILPSGPAHQVLKKFKNRTLYSNVVNDGIVPLRTSCLLFLDWRGLEKVEKARRDNGLVGTVAEWGWAALTGAPSSQLRAGRAYVADQEGLPSAKPSLSDTSKATPNEQRIETTNDLPAPNQFLRTQRDQVEENAASTKPTKQPSSPTPNPFQVLMSFLKIQRSTRENKLAKIYKRSQTIRADSSDQISKGNEPSATHSDRPGRARGDSLYEEGGLNTPPRTTLFESAGDVISPPLPPLEYLLDPSARPRTIFHDRVYHPEDIPPPPPARPRTIFRSASHNSNSHGTNNTDSSSQSGSTVPSQQTVQGSSPNLTSGMKVEEKIARAYHRDISWRKVLVRLEPDAHNNIIVRRMFANAYGWPVVKHLVDTHFAYTHTATTADDQIRSEERALPMGSHAAEHGEEVRGQTDQPSRVPSPFPSPPAKAQGHKEQSEIHKTATGRNSEENDTVPEMLAPSRLNTPRIGSPRICASSCALEDGGEESSHRAPDVRSRASSVHSKLSRQSSAQWTDRYLEDGEDDEYFEDVDGFDEIRDTFTVRSRSSSMDAGKGKAGSEAPKGASQPRKTDSEESEVD